MSRLFKFEIKRMKYKKIHIILPLIIISIGLVGIITGNAFNENLTSKVKMLNIFQAYTQFSFIFLGFVYIYLFTEDSIKGTDKYISQLGYSLAVQILFKSLILYAYMSIPWWRSHPIHKNRAPESIWTEPCNPLLRAAKSTKRATFNL